MSNSDHVSNGVWEKQPSVCWGFLRLGANEENKEGSQLFLQEKLSSHWSCKGWERNLETEIWLYIRKSHYKKCFSALENTQDWRC